MKTYKCKGCTHEVIRSSPPPECDICGSCSVVLLENFHSSKPSKKTRTPLKSKHSPAPIKKTKKRPSIPERKVIKSPTPAKSVGSSAFVSVGSKATKFDASVALKTGVRAPVIKESGRHTFPAHSTKSKRSVARKRSRPPGFYIASLMTGLLFFGFIGVAVNTINTAPNEKNISEESAPNFPEEDGPLLNANQGCIGIRYAHFSELNIFKDEKPLEADLVLESTATMPAGEKGIKKGDLITEIDAQKTNSPSFLKDAVIAFEMGEKVPISILRPSSYEINELEDNQLSFNSTSPYTELTFEVPTAPCP